MCATIAFPVSSVTRPHGVLHLCSTSCQTGEHHECSGHAELPGMAIECTCTCHDGKPSTVRQSALFYQAA